MDVDSLTVHEEVKEVNLQDDEDELLNDCPPNDDDSKEKTENVRNDSGLETSDSMDAVKEPPPLMEMIPLSAASTENFPSNVTITISDSKLPELQPLPPIPLESPEKSPNLSRRSSTSFIDSLLNKINRSSGSSESSPIKTPKLNDDNDLLEEIEQSVTFEKSNNPNMLPTPIVKNPRAASAFVNSEDDMGIQLKQPSNQVAKFDRSKMSAKSQPPKMNAPNYSNIPKPRTLAEKRMLVNTNMDFLMIEQEAKIFKQIERKKKGEALNYNLIESMMNEDIPINYGPWKALQWLITQEGNYIQQHIDIDGVNYRLTGSRGNHVEKYLPRQSNKPYPKVKKIGLRSVRCCAGGKIKKREIDQLVNVESIKRFVLEESVEPYKRLESKNILNQLTSIKPRPLSKKIEFINQNKKLLNANEDSMFLGQFSKFKMPDIKLEVTVQNKVPLNPIAKKYLNEILPYRDMNENWINFALAPLKTEEDTEEKKVFEFTVPYHEDKQHILVREIIKSKQDTEKLRIFDSNDDDVDEMEWTFAKDADKNDKLEMEIVDVIKDLTNSVFINLNDDLFTRDDDEERVVPVCPIKPKEAIEELATKQIDSKNDKSKKILNELRRLNANVVKSDAAQVVDQDIRHRATAHLGREERELRATVIVTDSDTVLLGNTEKETRRKRVPKRFNDYLHPNTSHTDDHEKEVEIIPPVKRVKQEESQTRTRTPPPDKCSSEDLKTIRQEIQKWLHVTVDVNRMEVLGQVQHWCMLHNAYKCACKNVGLTLTPEYKAYKRISNPSTANNSLNSSRANSPEREVESNEENPRRVLPYENKNKEKARKKKIENIISQPVPPLQMEIVNLTELINKGIGPIFINIYDTKENRLKPILRSILNNKTALAYIDGFAYFIDTSRVDVRRLNFDKMRPILEHPIFIIMPKVTYKTGNCEVSKDFTQLLFKRESDVLKDITDKKQLKEIADIIELILENAKNKVRLQIGGEPSEHVREQLNMIRRDRYASESTNSSTLTSPLHFNGKELEKAPSPGPDSELMQEFNKIFSIRMQRLCAMIKANALGLHPLDGFVNKFYIYRWDLLLEAYESEIIFIWQVEMGEDQLIMVITDNKNPPAVENSKAITNIRTLSLTTDKMTELSKLVLLRVENAKTRNMTILLFGCQGYFRVCGLLNSKENYVDGFVAKPTRVTHPRLTAKIQKIYNVWYEIKKSKKKPACEIESKDLANNSNVSKEPEIIDLECNEKEIPDLSDTPEIPESVDDENEPEVIEIPKSLSNKTQSSNEAVEDLEPPKKISSMPKSDEKQNLSDRKWFLFNITNDFSDIFIKQWGRYLSFHTIIRAIKLARDKQKAVQLIPIEGSHKVWPKVFALPNAPLKFKDQHTMTNNFLIFGPYARSANSNLLLMQSDGEQKFLRDDYEKIHSIKRTVRTRCIWIYANILKCITESNVEVMYFQWEPQKKAIEKKKSSDQENTLKISSIIGGFTSDSIRNRSSV